MSKRNKTRPPKARTHAPRPGGRDDAAPSAAPAPSERAASAPAASPADADVQPGTSLLGPSEGFAEKLAPYGRRRVLWVVAACLATWCFGAGMRLLWVAEHPLVDALEYQGERILSTEDGYYYAAGVRAETEGFPSGIERVPTAGESMLVALGAAVVETVGASVHAVANWLPAFVAPLVAIPLLLLGLMFNRLLWGFIAALVTVLGFSYWNRTIPGYFDTDMLVITYGLTVMSLMIAALWRRRVRLFTIAALLALPVVWVHPGSERTTLALVFGLIGFSVVFLRKDVLGYRGATMLFVAFLPLPIWLKALVIVALDLGLERLRPIPYWAYGLVLFALIVWLGRTNAGMFELLRFVGIELQPGAVGPHVSLPGDGNSVTFKGLGETINELQVASTSRLAERIAGHAALAVTGLLGMLAMFWRYRPLLLALPFVALGTVFGGQRYTIFAVPIFALGNAYLLFLVGRAVARFVRNRPRLARRAEPAMALALTPLLLVPAITHALDYDSRTALTRYEAEQLTELADRIEPGDYVFTWWDYAYGVWYFAGAPTVIDGAKQNADTWLVAEGLFTPSQREAASLARLAAEEQVHWVSLDTIVVPILAKFVKATGRPVKELVGALRDGSAPLPEPTRKVYVYLPWRLLTIAPAVAEVRLAKGLVPADEAKNNFLITIHLDAQGRPLGKSNWRYDPAKQALVGTNASGRALTVPIYKLIEIRVGGRRAVHETVVAEDGQACVVSAPRNGLVLYMSRSMCESVMTQLMFLDAADPRYFRLESSGRGGLVYRVMP